VFPYPSDLIPCRTPRRISRSLASTLAVLTITALASGLPTASAQAASTATCPTATLSTPFLRWGDANFYTLVAGGDFEGSLSGWTLSGGAQRVAGSESYAVTGVLGGSSLALPVGASAQSPFTCVGSNERTFRSFARREGTAATIRASVVYETPLGNVAVPVGSFAPNSSWEPSPIFHTGAALATAIANGTVHVALRFTSVSGSARIDDVFLDPRHR
jgi:hypothetical protein